MKSLGYGFAGSILSLVLLLSACGGSKGVPSPSSAPTPSAAPAPSAAQSLADWDRIVAAATREGTVTVYNTFGAAVVDVLKTGGAKYGIKVDTIGGTGAELEAKIATEQRAKAFSGDLISGGWTTPLNVVRAGYGQPVDAALPALDEKDVWKIHPSKFDPTKTNYVLATFITPSVVVNTDLVKRGDISSWQDLLDSKWRDKIAMTDPRTGSGPGATGLSFWMTVLGEDYWKKLATQRIALQIRYDLAASQTAYGEKSLAIFPSSPLAVAAMKSGAPLQIVHFKEGTSYALNGVAVLKNAPHPNAALVLLNWLLSKDGQAAICKALESYTLRKDVNENWFTIAELRSGTFTMLEPPNNLDPQAGSKGASFGNTAFGVR